MSIKLTCTKIHPNQSSPFPEYFDYVRSSNDPGLLVSPLVVAGIVIGLVLFLSCVTIIIGSLRKDGGVRDLQVDPDYDGVSCAGSAGDLRSVRLCDNAPAFEFGPFLELNVSYPDPPPRYDDCVGPGVTAIYLPTDDPPPYSLEDPHLGHELALNISAGEGLGQTARSSEETTCPLLTATSLSSVTIQVAPSYGTRSTLSVHLPLIPMDVLKDTSPLDIPVRDGDVYTEPSQDVAQCEA
ncbi:hypothetical protein FKM82_003605 [Ascaphus truei]